MADNTKIVSLDFLKKYDGKIKSWVEILTNPSIKHIAEESGVYKFYNKTATEVATAAAAGTPIAPVETIDLTVYTSNSDFEDLKTLVGQPEKDGQAATGLCVLTAGEATEGSVAYQIAQIVNENDDGKLNTLKEIAAWIVNDTTGAAKMANDIAANKTAIGQPKSQDADTGADIPATGLYKYVDDSCAEVQNDFVYAEDSDLDAMFPTV